MSQQSYAALDVISIFPEKKIYFPEQTVSVEILTHPNQNLTLSLLSPDNLLIQDVELFSGNDWVLQENSLQIPENPIFGKWIIRAQSDLMSGYAFILVDDVETDINIENMVLNSNSSMGDVMEIHLSGVVGSAEFILISSDNHIIHKAHTSANNVGNLVYSFPVIDDIDSVYSVVIRDENDRLLQYVVDLIPKTELGELSYISFFDVQQSKMLSCFKHGLLDLHFNPLCIRHHFSIKNIASDNHVITGGVVQSNFFYNEKIKLKISMNDNGYLTILNIHWFASYDSTCTPSTYHVSVDDVVWKYNLNQDKHLTIEIPKHSQNIMISTLDPNSYKYGIFCKFFENNGEFMSPYKQIRLGFDLDEIICNGDLLLSKRPDSSIACVRDTTSEKLGWQTI